MKSKITSDTHFFCMLLIILCSTFILGLLQNVQSQCKPCNDPEYIANKMNFYKQFQAYKDDLSYGIIRTKPVDPSGLFEIDNNGNFVLRHNKPDVQNNSPVFRSPFTGDAVSSYAWSQDTTTFTTIVGGSGTVALVTGYCDDNEYAGQTIGFTFNFNGINYTTYNVTCNGTLLFSTYGGYYEPICYGVDVQTVCPFANDLEGNATGDGLYYQLSGSAPNRVYTVEWHNWGFYGSSGGDLLSFQIKLFETTNVIQFIYQPHTPSYTSAVQVGLGGLVSTSDYNTRTSTSNWSATTAGTACSEVSFSPTIYPANGLRYKFSPPAPPPVPTLIRPVNHAIGRPLYDTLQWSASSGATNYNLQIAIDSLFATMVFNDTTMTGTSYTIGQFTPLTNWWWRVRAKNANGWSAFATQWTFRTMGPASQVTLFTPVNNAVNQPITNLLFAWSHAIDQTAPLNLRTVKAEPLTVSNYWYALYTDTTQSPVVVDSTLTDTTKTVSGLLNNTNYWWKVRAKNNVSYGPFSSYFHFTTVVAIPAVPTLISPINGALLTSLVPTLDWSNVPTATSYRVQVSIDSTFATSQLDSTTTRDSLIVPAGRLSNGAIYYWHVRAINAGGNSNYSVIWHFSTPVGIQNIGNEIPSVYKLYNNYPNPFNPVSTIKFDIPKSSDVKLMIFNALGQEVLTLVNSHFEAGSYSVQWNAANYPSGVYFYKLTSGIFSDIHKMVLIK